MLKGFRDFILRGNVVDLAVAVILGAAFNAIVASFVKDVLTQLIAAVVGKPDFKDVVFKLNGSPIYVGNFLNAVISFLIVA
ncbi:MAG: large conductance mechanosensitive channel protein MscL, partial [Terracidiphilus sp.]